MSYFESVFNLQTLLHCLFSTYVVWLNRNLNYPIEHYFLYSRIPFEHYLCPAGFESIRRQHTISGSLIVCWRLIQNFRCSNPAEHINHLRLYNSIFSILAVSKIPLTKKFCLYYNADSFKYI